jgi:hypothetical protein
LPSTTGKWEFLYALLEAPFIKGIPAEMATSHFRTFVHTRQNKNKTSQHDFHKRCVNVMPVHACLE